MMTEHRANGEFSVTMTILPIERNIHILRIWNDNNQKMIIELHVNGEHNVTIVTLNIEPNITILNNK